MEIPVQPRRERKTKKRYRSGTWILLTGLEKETRALKEKISGLSRWSLGSLVPSDLRPPHVFSSSLPTYPFLTSWGDLNLL